MNVELNIEQNGNQGQPSESAAGEPTIRIAAMHELEHFQACVDLQVAVWGYSDGDVVPRRMFLLADRIGGQVLGAFDGEKVAGFAMALPGYRDRQPYLHSHMLAVLPEYRNLGLGRRLKLAQRDDAIARGFELMEWTFDPLEIKNAYLNIARLGAICRRYQPDFYGPSTSPLQGGLPTDRLYAEWWLRSPRVRRCLGEQVLLEHVLLDQVERGLEAGQGIESGAAEVLVPHEISEWKQAADTRDRALEVQHRNREALQSAFGRGLAVVGYRRDGNGDGRFLLGSLEAGDLGPIDDIK
jgi:predicted GNAT superfamily acetyltransferase